MPHLARRVGNSSAFSLAGLMTGAVMLSVDHPLYLPIVDQEIELIAGEPAVKDVRLEAGKFWNGHEADVGEVSGHHFDIAVID